MTKQRDLKQLIRERMSKTGERYAAARAQIISKLGETISANSYPGLLDGYPGFGGTQGDTAALRNVLRHSRINSPDTGRPYTEAMVNGLCGGPGFLYAVFEYKGWPPMLTLAMRSRSMPDIYIAEGLSRIGVQCSQSETTSPKSARKSLDKALLEGKAALCVADMALLPWYGLPKEFAGGAPHVIAVVGRDGDEVWVDDRSPRPFRLPLDHLDRARSAYRKAQNRLITIEGAMAGHDSKKAILGAIADTARGYVEPAIPRSFWVNCGFSGIDKWRQMLTDRKDKKGWPTVFAESGRAFAGLQRAYECIEWAMTAPAGGRAFYADFLDEAAQVVGRPILLRAAVAFREAGVLWAQVAGLIAHCDDPAVREACIIADRRIELSDAHGDGLSIESAELWQKRRSLGAECKLTKDSAMALYGKIAEVVERISAAEHAVVDLCNGASG